MSHLRRIAAALFAVALLPGAAVAQQGTGTVSGMVVDQASEQPIQGASVSIANTTLGALTNAEGSYTITGVPAGRQELRARFIGYLESGQPVTVVAGQTVTANFSLTVSAVQLNVIVVNAITGQEERKRETGANVSNIPVADLNKGPITKFADVLTGRTAGVTLQGVAGTTGTSQRIRIRGANSLSLSNEPLIYLDGVLMSNSTGGLGVGGQDFSRLNDINASDIANVEVLKGPAASALYGTAAANGVLLITTKRGQPGRTRWNAYVETGLIEDETDYPDNFFAYSIAPANFGAPLFRESGSFNTTIRPGCLNYRAATGACVQDSVLTFNTLQDSRTTPFSTGNRQKYGLNAAGGTDVVTYFISGDYEDETGVIDYNIAEKVSVRANLQAQLRDNLSVNVTTGYVDSKVALNQNDNNIFSPLINGIAGGAVFFPAPNDSTRSFRNYGFGFTPEEISFLVTHQEVDRFTMGTNANFTPLDWLTLNGNLGLDLTDRFDFETLQPELLPIALTFDLGFRTAVRTNTYLYTGNTSAVANFVLTPSIVSTSTVGGSYQRTLSENASCFGAGIVAGTRNCGASTRFFDVDEDFFEVITLGGFFQQELAFNDRVFLAAAIRGDDNSAFGQDFGLIYYPSASLSWVVAEEPWFPAADWVSNLRLRGAYGTSGLRPNFRDAVTFFSPVAVTVGAGDVAGITLGNTGNLTLEPEKTTEYELGFDVGLLDSRLAVDFTYFNKRSRDALIERDIAPSFGLTGSIFQNLGSIRNSGTELEVNALVLDVQNVRVNLRFSNTTLDNEIEELGEGIPAIIFNRGNQRHQEGFPAGAFFQIPVIYEDVDRDGLLAVAEVSLGDSAVYLGPSLPTYTRSLGADVTLFDIIRVTTLFDARGGNKQINATESFRCRFTLGFGDRGCGALFNPNASLEDQAAFIGRTFYGSEQLFIEDADFVKWRELSVTLSVPETLSDRIVALSGATLTLAGRNLATWTDYGGLDPEINETGGSSNFTQGEFNTQPPVRYYTVRLNFAF
ncbi:MAG: SusC/RagA family TonB-linked outer membrane protein [Gemmatimonadaceae bacterium]